MAFTCLNPDQAVKVEVSYLQPTFTVSYLDINICAAVTFPDVLSVDVVTPTDLVALTTTKALSDTYSGFQDTAIRGFVKASTDSVTMTDDIDIDFFLQKLLADTQGISDTDAYQLLKGLFESLTPADVKQLSFVKELADIVNTPVDSVAYAIEKSLSETTTFSDFVTTTLIFIRTFADSSSASDDVDVLPQLSKSEVLSSVDTDVLSVDKAFSEGLNLLDNMDGDIEYVFIKLVSELLVASDAQAVDFASNKSDNAVLSSSGILSMQDYCDITYFLEDYVGVSRTFT
jgi:hypothetical protein